MGFWKFSATDIQKFTKISQKSNKNFFQHGVTYLLFGRYQRRR
nr:MAG TPA: hypothetical protein [Caudoviricetes sp.]